MAAGVRHTSVGVKGAQGGGREVRTNRQDDRLLLTRDGIVQSPSVLASAALLLPLVPLKSAHNTLILWTH